MYSISKAISLNYGNEIIAMLCNVSCSQKTYRFWDEDEHENKSEFLNAKKLSERAWAGVILVGMVVALLR